MAYLTYIEDQFDSRVTSRCNLQVLSLVYDKLDAEHKELLVHDEVWFRVGDANIRFGFSDFPLITGLNPRIENDFVKDIPSDRQLAAEYFAGGKKAVKPSQLKAAFEHHAKNEEDRYKLGLALIYECVLWCKEPTTSIDMKILQVVDNLDLVNKYPWGRSSYNYLLHSLTKTINTKVDHHFPRGFTHDDEVLFPLSPTQEEMEKEYVVMFPGMFPEDLSYPLDEQTVPTDDREMTEHGGSSRVPPPSTGPSIGMRQLLDVVATLTKKQDDTFSFLNKKVKDAFSLMSGKIEELDRKIYALDQKLEARSQPYTWFTPERQRMETGLSPDYRTVVETENNKSQAIEEEEEQVVEDHAEDQCVEVEEEEEHDQVVEDHAEEHQTEKTKSVEVEKNKAGEVVDTEMQQHSDVEVVEQADMGDDRGMVKYTRKKRSSKHVEKENVLQTGVKRARVPSIHTRSPFTIESRPQTTTSRTFLDKMQIDFFLPVDPLKAKKFKEWYTKAADR
ncbi:hypothetical protein DH2020_047121 [Rehmannia glutinosa]|uniref:DUF1985 domain-containing protein n=1 Tax=Rehmannia glutinosa TaxID=99300 RepID=A0ABR0UAB4_REHGL